MVLTLALSGCNLVEKDLEVDNALVILSYNGTDVTKEEVVNLAYEQMYQEAQMYMSYGMSYDFQDSSKLQAAQEYVIENYFKPNLVVKAKISELGLDQFTPEELEEITAKATESYNTQRESVKTYDFSASKLEGDALEQAIDERMIEYGLNLDLFIESEKSKATETRLKEKIVEGITVTDQEVEDAFNQKVEADREAFAADPSSFASVVNNGTTVYYSPAGARFVKHILRSFPDETKTEITGLNSQLTSLEAEITSINEELTALNNNAEADASEKETLAKELSDKEAQLTNLKKELEDKKTAAAALLEEDVQKVLAKLEEGTPFDEVMAEFGEDPGMTQEPAKTTGYAIVENMSKFDPAFVKAGMALENIGDVSEPVVGLSGVHILQFTSEIKEGSIDFESVKTNIYDELLTQKQDEHYQAEVDAWVAAANITVNMKNLNR